MEVNFTPKENEEAWRLTLLCQITDRLAKDRKDDALDVCCLDWGLQKRAGLSSGLQTSDTRSLSSRTSVLLFPLRSLDPLLKKYCSICIIKLSNKKSYPSWSSSADLLSAGRSQKKINIRIWEGHFFTTLFSKVTNTIEITNVRNTFLC